MRLDVLKPLGRLAKGMRMRYTIRALKLGEILDQAVKLTRDHFGVLIGITGILLIPFNLITGFIQISMIQPPPPTPTPEQAMAFFAATMRVTIPIALLAIFIVTPVTNAALVYAIADAFLEKPISVGGSVKHAFRRILPLVGTWFLVILAIAGGYILCVVPGILAAFWFSLATQVVVVEGVSGIAAMKRSKQLMAGNIGTIFVLGLLIGVINGGVIFGAGVIPQPHIRIVAIAVVNAVLTIFASAAFVVFYFSCRCKHEQFDLVLLAQSVGAETPTDLSGGATPQW
jgi:hypothetical protein